MNTSYSYGEIARRTSRDDAWSEPIRSRVTLFAPDRFSLADAGTIFLIDDLDGDAPVGTGGDRRVRLGPLLYHRLAGRLAERGPFPLHPCGAPIWLGTAGIVFSAMLKPHKTCPRCGKVVAPSALMPLPEGVAIVEVRGTLHVPAACLERKDALGIRRLTICDLGNEGVAHYALETDAVAALLGALGRMRGVASIPQVVAAPAAS